MTSVAQGRGISSRTIASAAIFTAFVAAATLAFAIVIPATNGYFNIGEVMVYIAALIMGPYVGAFAGGVGSAISDAILAPQFAPGTLVIKGLEGFIVGYLSRLKLANLSRGRWLAFSILTGIGLGALVGYLGAVYLSGEQTLYLGFSIGPTTPIGPQVSYDFFVPWFFWVFVGGLAFIAVLWAGYNLDERLGWTIVSVLVGGSEMVTGYFLFESVGLQLGFVSASAEVPFNIGQVLVGLLVAVPAVRSYRRMVRRAPMGAA